MELKLSRSPIWIAVDSSVRKMQVMLTFPSLIHLVFSNAQTALQYKVRQMELPD